MPDNSCQDIDECKLSLDTCNHTCVNSEGTYQCFCRQGYLLMSDGYSCEDVDECKEGTHDCGDQEFEVCRNTAGNFNCDCIGSYARINSVCQSKFIF